MKFASFRTAAGPGWGLVTPEGVIDLSARHADLKAAIAAGDLAAGQGPLIPLEGIVWEPVIPNPDKILCIGLNYEMHRSETGREKLGYPTIFTRFANSQIGHLTDAVCPAATDEFDYEGELAIVIGTPGRAIPRDSAMAHIAGYACYNDMSVRDWQRHSTQFTAGKNFPATGAFGPWLVTPDEVGALPDLRISTRVNGQTVQDAHLGDMIFDIPHLIEYCSAFTRLEPGDVIVTGTPGGIGSRRNPPLWLHPGDLVEVEVERVGLLQNRVVAE